MVAEFLEFCAVAGPTPGRSSMNWYFFLFVSSIDSSCSSLFSCGSTSESSDIYLHTFSVDVWLGIFKTSE